MVFYKQLQKRLDKELGLGLFDNIIGELSFERDIYFICYNAMSLSDR